MLSNSHVRDSGWRQILNYYYYYHHHHHKLTFSTKYGGRVICLQRLVWMSATPSEGCATFRAPFCPVKPPIPSTTSIRPNIRRCIRNAAEIFVVSQKSLNGFLKCYGVRMFLGSYKSIAYHCQFAMTYFLRFLLWCSRPKFLVGSLTSPSPMTGMLFVVNLIQRELNTAKRTPADRIIILLIYCFPVSWW